MELLKVGDRTITVQEMMPLLSQHGLLPRLVQEVLIDSAIADVELTADEKATAEAEFYQRNQINNANEAALWAKQRYGEPEMVPTLAERDKRLAKFKQATFDKDVDSYFLQRKSRLDRVLYSLIRTQQPGLAQELYFRVHDDGQSFADLAREYSEGQEAKTGGLIGPVELSVPHPSLAGLLSISQPGQIWPPKRIGEWYIVVRLEKFFPAQLDEAMRQRMIDELFQQWLKEQIQTTPVSTLTPDFIPVKAETIIDPALDAEATAGAPPSATTLPADGPTIAVAARAEAETINNGDASATPEVDPWT